LTAEPDRRVSIWQSCTLIHYFLKEKTRVVVVVAHKHTSTIRIVTDDADAGGFKTLQ
jgi:hypothetical protein